MYGQRVSRSFKDISLSFDPHPVTKDLPVLKNENAIRRSVRNLVQTIPGEDFLTHFWVHQCMKVYLTYMILVFLLSIEQEILATLENFEPRVANVKFKSNLDLIVIILTLQSSLIL